MTVPAARAPHVRRLLAWLTVLAYMAGIFWLSSQPRLPDLPESLTDKHAHALAYGGLCALAGRAAAGGTFGAVRAGTAAAGWGIAVAYGVTDEWHQSYVPGRSTELADLAADAIGAGIAAAALWAWGIITRSRRARRRMAPPA